MGYYRKVDGVITIKDDGTIVIDLEGYATVAEYFKGKTYHAEIAMREGMIENLKRLRLK